MFSFRARFFPPRRTSRRYSYEDEQELEQFLPTNSRPANGNIPSHHRSNRCLRRTLSIRKIFLLLAVLGILFVLYVLRRGIPPTFERIRAYERSLPQHNVTEALHDTSLDPPRRRRYLRLEGGVWGHGINNHLQQFLHMSFLAHSAGRAFVFEEFTWSHLPLPFTIYVYGPFILRPTRMPMNAIISGASSGGILSKDGSNTLRSVMLDFFDQVCPEKERVVFHTLDAPRDDQAQKGTDIMDWWLAQLKGVEDKPCVVIRATEEVPIFEQVYFGSQLPLSVFPAFNSSPTLTHFSWSPLVSSAVARNFALFQADVNSLGGLVAVHLRRGDYSRHCPRLHGYRSDFMGWNKFEGLPDKFTPPPYPDSDETLHEYLRHCIPEIPEIVERLRQVRKDRPSLNRVFLMSNGDSSWLSSLGSKLREDGWGKVSNTYDIRLDAEQTQVSGAVDMAIAEKAEVFVGNGFSSLSANIVLLRLAKGVKPESNRFL